MNTLDILFAPGTALNPCAFFGRACRCHMARSIPWPSVQQAAGCGEWVRRVWLLAMSWHVSWANVGCVRIIVGRALRMVLGMVAFNEIESPIFRGMQRSVPGCVCLEGVLWCLASALFALVFSCVFVTL